MDEWFRTIGGTVFRNCYSPAPDTPRSLACLYTGLLPKNNGCTTRIRWPEYYLKHDVPTVFSSFLNDGYSLFTTFSESRLNVGILPPGIRDESTDLLGLPQLVERRDEVMMHENVLLFVDLQDYHACVDDFGSLGRAHRCGDRQLSLAFDKVFQDYSVDDFDVILVLSDHGCKLSGDKRYQEPHYLPFDDRSKIVMFVHRKGDSGLECDDHL